MASQHSADRVAELMRRVIDRVREDQEALFDTLDRAVLQSQPPEVADDPVLAAAIRRTIRNNITVWLEAVYEDPLGAVPPNDSLDAVAVAEEFRRRDLEDASVAAFRNGQGAAWEAWVELGSSAIDDAHDLSAFLTQSARSIFAYIDATTAAITDRLDHRGPPSTSIRDRRAHVDQLLSRRAVDVTATEHALGYRLDQTHLAVVTWSHDLPGADLVLDAVVEELQRAMSPRPLLHVQSGAATRWLWIGGLAAPDLDAMTAVVDHEPTVGLAAGSPGSGIDGFRSSHREALAAQQVIARRGPPLRSASWAHLELVSLLLRDEAAARRFIARTLGDLTHADPEVRETVRTYLRCSANATHTAQAMFVHRNTVIGRIKRAEASLPRPLASDGLAIAAALEAARWLPD